MLALWTRTGTRITFCRVAIELFALSVGFALGDTVGVGTVLLATLVGPCLQASFRALDHLGLTLGPTLPELSPVNSGGPSVRSTPMSSGVESV